MKIFWTFLFCSALATGTFFGWHALNDKQQHGPKLTEFDAAQLLDLKPFGDWDPDRHFTHDLSLIFYFNELSCQTCTTRELQNVARWYEQFGQRMDFYLVVQGQNATYLHNLRRLGRVKYPILTTEHPGQMNLPKTTIALFRKNTQEILASYFPSPDEPHPEALTQLETRLLQELGDPAPQGAIGGGT